MLAGKSLSFSFSLSVGNNFSFSVESRGKGALSSPTKKKKKKPTPSTVRQNARRREEFLRKKLASSAKESHQGISEEEAETADLENIFKCDQCRNTFKSENGLKIHVGKSHKKVTQVQATPDQLRQQPEGPMDTSIIPLLDVSKEEPCLNSVDCERRTCTCSNLNCCGCFHGDSCECRQKTQ